MHLLLATATLLTFQSSFELQSKDSLIGRLLANGMKETDVRGVFRSVFQRQQFDMARGTKFKLIRYGVAGVKKLPEAWLKDFSTGAYKAAQDTPKPSYPNDVVFRIGAVQKDTEGFYVVEAARIWGVKQGVVEQFKVSRAGGKWKIWKVVEVRRF